MISLWLGTGQTHTPWHDQCRGGAGKVEQNGNPGRLQTRFRVLSRQNGKEWGEEGQASCRSWTEQHARAVPFGGGLLGCVDQDVQAPILPARSPDEIKPRWDQKITIDATVGRQADLPRLQATAQGCSADMPLACSKLNLSFRLPCLDKGPVASHAFKSFA